MKKILVDCHVFDQSLQGTTSYIKGIYLELIKDKSKIFYFVSHNYNLQEIFGIQHNVNYLKYKSKNKFYRLSIELPQIIKRHKIDYAHFQYIVPPIKNCKYIVTLHDVLFLDYPSYFPFIYKVSKKILYNLSAKYSDIVLTVSEYSKQRIQYHFKVNNISITPNAVDSSFFDSHDKDIIRADIKNRFKAENYFLFVSRWEPRKNHYLLLKVFVENEFYKNYNLVFVGSEAIEDQRYNSYYQSLSQETKNKIFKFTKLNFEDLLFFTKAATLCVYPSIAEGFGIPPLEAIASETPSICSNTTAMSDFCFMKNNQFDPNSQKDMADKIKIGLSDKNLFEKKLALLEKYSWEKSAQVLNDLL